MTNPEITAAELVTPFLITELSKFLANRRVSLLDSWLNHATSKGFAAKVARDVFDIRFDAIEHGTEELKESSPVSCSMVVKRSEPIDFAESELGKTYGRSASAYNNLMRKLDQIPNKFAARHKLYSMVMKLAEAKEKFGRHLGGR